MATINSANLTGVAGYSTSTRTYVDADATTNIQSTFSSDRQLFNIGRLSTVNSGQTITLRRGTMVIQRGSGTPGGGSPFGNGTANDPTWNISDFNFYATGRGTNDTDGEVAIGGRASTHYIANLNNVEVFGDGGNPMFFNNAGAQAGSTFSNVRFVNSYFTTPAQGLPIWGFEFDGTVRTAEGAVAFTLRASPVTGGSTDVVMIGQTDFSGALTGTQRMIGIHGNFSNNVTQKREVWLINNLYHNNTSIVALQASGASNNTPVDEYYAMRVRFQDIASAADITDSRYINLPNTTRLLGTSLALGGSGNGTSLQAASLFASNEQQAYVSGNATGFLVLDSTDNAGTTINSQAGALVGATTGAFRDRLESATLRNTFSALVKSFSHSADNYTVSFTRPSLFSPTGTTSTQTITWERDELVQRPVDAFLNGRTSAISVADTITSLDDIYPYLKKDWWDPAASQVAENFGLAVSGATITFDRPVTFSQTLNTNYNAFLYTIRTSGFETGGLNTLDFGTNAVNLGATSFPVGSTIQGGNISNFGDTFTDVTFSGSTTLRFTGGARTISPTGTDFTGVTAVGTSPFTNTEDRITIAFDASNTIPANHAFRTADYIIVEDAPAPPETQPTRVVFNLSSFPTGARYLIFRGINRTNILMEGNITEGLTLRYTDDQTADGEEFTLETDIARDYGIVVTSVTGGSILDRFTSVENTALENVPNVFNTYVGAAQPDQSANINTDVDITGRSITAQAHENPGGRDPVITIPFDVDGCPINDRPSEPQCNRMFAEARQSENYLKGIVQLMTIPAAGQRTTLDVMQFTNGGLYTNLRNGDYRLINPEVGEGQQYMSGVYDTSGAGFTQRDDENDSLQLSTNNLTGKNPDVVGQLRRIGLTNASLTNLEVIALNA